ncbi:hypothetical protein MTsPCn9_04210 [Croceitalea sp. MTPC9]|nr:hypothetical protein MTsPCn6_04500 [Croceitalea sp. MTPC6]GMN15485.1 hypothetical protein MTsPCn9_04210 [Croceitalea sp. MTPC9]
MIKDYKEFEKTLNNDAPCSDWSLALKALWYAANNNWEASHEIAQDLYTPIGSWIHAHLHRVESDEFNAGYWYRQARKPFSKSSFKEEIREILETVLRCESK